MIDHKQFKEQMGKDPWELDFHEAVEQVGDGFFGDLEDSQVQYYILLALSNTLKKLELKSNQH